ncbi:MAG: hypothetical protein NVS3B20_24990 [Polyangiales bacterium]
MLAPLNKVAPGVKPKINLGADCLILIAASVVATMSRPHVFYVGPSLAVAGLAIALWIVGSRVLRQYDPWRAQPLLGDLAITTVLLLAVGVGLCILRHASPLVSVMRMRHFLMVAIPGIVWFRLMVPWMRVFSDAVEAKDVLIVGTGALGRMTGLDIRGRDAQGKLFAYLSFPGEPSNERLPAKVLGTSDDLERILRERAFGEVFIAGNMRRDADAMQKAIRVCEGFGVPFALPLSHFRFDRARPANSKAVHDGFVHYLSIEHKPFQLAIKRLFDIAASATALALLSPLLLVVALVIKATSRGPVLFRLYRVGRYGRPFNML